MYIRTLVVSYSRVVVQVRYNVVRRAAERWLPCICPVCSGMVVGFLYDDGSDFCPICRSIV